AAVADLFLQIRAGTDIAFLGGLINYALQNNRIAKDYLVTNAAFIVKDGFKLPEDGLFSGFDAAATTYDKATWNYEEVGNLGPKTENATPVAAATTVKPAPTGGTESAKSAPASAKTSSPQKGGDAIGGGHQAAG